MYQKLRLKDYFILVHYPLNSMCFWSLIHKANLLVLSMRDLHLDVEYILRFNLF